MVQDVREFSGAEMNGDWGCVTFFLVELKVESTPSVPSAGMLVKGPLAPLSLTSLMYLLSGRPFPVFAGPPGARLFKLWPPADSWQREDS